MFFIYSRLLVYFLWIHTQTIHTCNIAFQPLIKKKQKCEPDAIPSGSQNIKNRQPDVVWMGCHSVCKMWTGCPTRPVVKCKKKLRNGWSLTVPHPVLKSYFNLTTGRRSIWFTDCCTLDGTPCTLHPVVIIRTGWLPYPVLKIQKMRTGWAHPGVVREI